MPTKRVLQAGHILAMVFIALLLAGARGFLGAHPVLSGVLLALVAPVYYVAAYVSGHRQFLHPASLLAVLGFQLVVYGAGVRTEFQPLASLIPAGLLFLAASRSALKRIEDSSLSLYGATNFIIGAFSLWILQRISVQFANSPWATALALGSYAAYAWLGFRRTQKTAYLLAMVVLGSAAFFFLLYSAPALALGLGAAAGLLVMADLFRRHMLPRLEAAAFTLVGAYLVFMAAVGSRAAQIPLGYLVLAGTWLHLGLAMNRPGLPPLAGPHPAPLPRLLPPFGAGIVLALAPAALSYPWTPVMLPVPYLAILFVMFLATSRELAKQSFSLIGVLLARGLAVLARLAPLAALLYLAVHQFPASYRIGLASLALAVLSLLAAWRQAPRIFVRRNLYAYQAAAFLTIAYFVAARRLGLAGAGAVLLDSGALLVLVIAGVAWALRSRVAPELLITLYESACLPAAIGCVLQVSGGVEVRAALLVGVLLLAACGAVFARVRLPAVVFTAPIVLGLWIYVAEQAAGARGETLGLPYLVFGFVSAGAGYLLLRRGNSWYHLFYFMWFLCTGISVVLFFPLRAEGAYAAPLWPITFLLVGRAVTARRDLAFAVALEAISALLAAGILVELIAYGLYLPAAVALFIDAILYAWIGFARDIEAYVYPAAMCVVAGYFFVVLAAGREQLFLTYLAPVAAVMYLIAAVARRKGLVSRGWALEFAASAGAVAGSLLFLSLPFASHTMAGVLTGVAYLAIYAIVSSYTRNRVFLTGIALAGAFAFYEFLPLLPKVNRGNRLAFFVPVALLLILLGRRQYRARDTRGAWGLYAAAIVVTALASVFAMWPQPADPGASRVVLLVAIAVWPVLLVWTANEIFIYCATLGIAMLAYHFVQSSADMFGQHLVAFFLFGTAMLGLVFVAAALRKRVRFRRPTLLVAPAHWYSRIVYLVPVVVLGAATFGSWGVSSSSNPHFCGSCHNMGTYFASWKKSPHARADVSCASCHYDPGLSGYVRAKMKGTSQLVATLTQSASNRPEAQVSNETCLRSGCHSAGQLARPVSLRTVSFQHQQHLGPIAVGPQLRCTSCHTSVDPETHFAVDTNTCFTCHFNAGLTTGSAGKAGCVACHGVPQRKVAFDHVSAGIAAEDRACSVCHERTVAGTPAVEPRQCRHCHVESAAQLMAAGAADIHRRHVMGQGVNCDWCHGSVEHGRLDRTMAEN